MDNAGPIFLLVGNCCLIPLLAFFLGNWMARGMPGIPWTIVRRNSRVDLPPDPYDE